YPWLYHGLASSVQQQQQPADTVHRFMHWLHACTSQLPYLRYNSGHGVQHPYHPGVQSLVYQPPHTYTTSGVYYQLRGDPPHTVSSDPNPSQGCLIVNVTFHLQVNGKGHCVTSVKAPQQSLRNFFILAAFQDRCFSIETTRRKSRLPGTSRPQEGEYVKSVNGIAETGTMNWLVYSDSGETDLDLSTYQPSSHFPITADFADVKVIQAKYLAGN
ncbi:hypothetical protein Ahia01_000240400, partial [Argonauta hians]